MSVSYDSELIEIVNYWHACVEETVVVSLKISALKTAFCVDLVYMELQFRRHKE